MSVSACEALDHQDRLLHLGADKPGSRFIVAVAARIDNKLEPARLIAAISDTVRKEEILRTSLTRPHGMRRAVQIIAAPEAAQVSLQPIVSIADHAQDLTGWLEKVAVALLDESKARGQLIGFGFHRSVGSGIPSSLVIAASPLVLDLESLDTLLIRIAAVLAGEAVRETPQFADVTPWLNGREQARGPVDEPIEPRRRPDTRGATFTLGHHPVDGTMSTPVRFWVGEFVDVTRATVSAAWWFLLTRYIAGGGLELYLAVDRREAEEGLHGALGPYVASVPARDLDPDQSTSAALAACFDGILRRANSEHWEPDFQPTCEQQQFRSVVRWRLAPPSSAAQQLLQRIAAWEVRDLATLTLDCDCGPNGVRVHLLSDPRSIEAAHVQRLALELRLLIDAMARSPSTPPRDLLFWDTAAADSYWSFFNRDTIDPAAPGRLFHSEVLEVAARFPDRIAVDDGTHALSYRQLAAAAGAVHRRLRDFRPAPGAIVAVDLGRADGVAVVPAILGVLCAGAAFLPVDEQYPAARLSAAIDSVRPVAILSTDLERTRRRVGDSVPIVGLDRATGAPVGEDLLDTDAKILPVERNPGDPAYLIFTSGSTGVPKGVIVSHRGIWHYCAWATQAYGIAAGRGAVVVTSPSVDMTITSLLAPLLVAQRVVIVPDDDTMCGLARLAREADLSLVKLTPSHLAQLNALLDDSPPPGLVRTLVIGGEVLTDDVIAPWRDHAPSTRLVNEYGPTEAVVGCTLFDCAEAGGNRGRAMPIGRPAAGALIRVVDPQLRTLPCGQVGEIVVGGPCVAIGYHGAPAETAEKFVHLETNGGNFSRFYRTGDLGRLLPDSTLVFEGRIDDQIKLRGHRIEPGDVEAVLRTDPSVVDAAVVLDQNRVLTAIIETRAGAPAPRCSIEQLVAANLPDVMRPQRFQFVENLPRNAAGKVDRRALRAGLPDYLGEAPRAPPHTPVEAMLCRLFAEGLQRAEVGADDDYIALGGDSIRALRIMVKAAGFGIPLEVADFFTFRTARRISQQCEARSYAEAPPAPPPFDCLTAEDRQRLPPRLTDAVPASRLQLGMLYENEASPGGIYHDIFGYRLEMPFDEAAFRGAIDRAMARHPMLRASFDLAGFSEPLILFHDSADSLLDGVDAAACDADAKSELDRWVRDESARGFRIDRPPLVRFHVILAGPEAFLLGVSFHHAILDGWSDVSLLLEVFDDYLMPRAGTPAAPKPAPPPYSDFVRLERDALASKESAGYFRAKLQDAPALQLPFPASAGQRRRVGILKAPVDIPPDVSDRLQGLAVTWRVPLKTLLLALHMKVLSDLYRSSDVVTLVVVSGRPERAAAEEALGLFINTIPSRCDIGRHTWRSLCDELLNEEIADGPHRRFPALSVPGLSILAETLFYFTNYHNVDRFLARRGIDIELIVAQERTNFPLAANFALDPLKGQVVLELACDGDRFNGAWIDWIASCYAQIISAMAVEPDRRPVELAVCPPPPFGEGVAGAGLSGNLAVAAARFLHCATSLPTADAVVWRDQSLTYGELERRVARLGSLMAAKSVDRSDRVGLLFRRTPDLIAVMLACLAGGICFVPFDEEIPEKRFGELTRSARLKCILTDRADLPEWDAGDAVIHHVTGAGAAAERVLPVSLRAEASDVAYLIYTSGSSGVPKGVVVAQDALSSCLSAMDALLGQHAPGRMLALSSVSFDISLLELIWPLTIGGAVVLQEGIASVFRAEAATATKDENIDFSVFCFPPSADQAYVPLLLDTARFADRLGFSAVWMPERHFASFGGAFPNPSVAAAAVAAVTSRIGIRAGSLVLPLHHPVRVAEDWALLDNLAPGRVGVAFASGWDNQTEVLTRPSARPFLESVDNVRRLWRGEAIDVARADGRNSAVRIALPPTTPELDVWLSIARRRDGFADAAAIGTGVLTHLLAQSPEEFAANVATYRARHPGRGQVTLMLHALVSETRSEALEHRELLVRYVSAAAELDTATRGDHGSIVTQAVERFMGGSGLAGSVESCAERALAFRLAGADEIACLVDFNADSNRIHQQLERLDRVLTLCRARLAPASVAARPSGPLSFARNVELHRVTHLQCTPTLMRQLLQDADARRSLAQLDAVLIGGEVASPSLLAELSQVTQASVFNMYGPTEATIWATAARIEARDAEPFRQDQTVTIGQPLANSRVYILDPLEIPCPSGVEGQLCIAGSGLALGYSDGSRIDSGAFKPWRFGNLIEPRLYRTGDRARLTESGDIEFLGRADRQHKVAGYRVDLSEIEAVARRAAGVAEAVASVTQDGRLALSVIPIGDTIDVDAIQAAMADYLPLSLIPQLIEQQHAPMTLAGKLDRAAVASGSMVGRPEQHPPQAAWPSSLAGNVTEGIMLELWRESLKREILPDDDFFALGGASIVAMTLIAKVRERFNVSIPLRALITARTPRRLQAMVEASQTLAPLPAPEVSKPASHGTQQRTPMSYQQQQLLTLHGLAPGSAAYNDAVMLRIDGPFDDDAADEALALLVDRHMALRASFQNVGDETVQHIAPQRSIRMQRLDLRNIAADARAPALQREMLDFTRRPFDLDREGVLRILLIRSEEESRHILMVTHHAACDGWAQVVLLDEFAACIDALRKRRPPLLAPAPSFSAFAEEQRVRFSGARREMLEAFWSDSLKHIDADFEIPLDRKRETEPARDGHALRFVIPAPAVAAIEALAGKLSCTTYTVLLAAFGVVLHHNSGAERIVIGSDVAGRGEAWRRLVASTANQLVLSLDLTGDPDFETLTRQVGETLFEAIEHQDMPFGALVKLLGRPRRPGRHPLFQIAFTLQEGEPIDRVIAGTRFRQEAFDYGIARLDLEFNLQRSAGAIECVMIARADLFDASTVALLRDNYLRVLELAIDRPSSKLSAMAYGWNELQEKAALVAGDSVDVSWTFFDLFAEAAAAHPDARALVIGTDCWSYRELLEKVERMAAGLAQAGVERGSVVAVMGDRAASVAFVVLSVLHRGAAFLLVDSSHPTQRIGAMLAGAGCRHVVAEKFSFDRAEAAALAGGAASPQVLLFDDLAATPVRDTRVANAPDDLAYVCFTSGSTGTPKGAMISHRGMANHLHAKRLALRLSHRDIVAQTAPQTFDIYVWQLLAPLTLGATSIIYDDDVCRDADALSVVVGRDRVTIWEVVPSLLTALLDGPRAGRSGVAGAECLRYLVVTGETLEPELGQRWLECVPNVPMVNAYGPTECSDDVTHHIISNLPDPGAARIPLGSPIPNAELMIVNDAFRLLPRDALGELVIGGTCVGLGYAGDPERSALAFVKDPRHPARKLYRTGDLGRIRFDGTVEFFGRRDGQIKWHGQRIELEEISNVARRHSDVRDAVTVLWREPDEVPHLATFVTLEPQAHDREVTDDLSSIRQWEAIYDQILSDVEAEDMFVYQTAGWNSSYDGLPIPRLEMQNWLDDTHRRLKRLPRARVLELGCGTGMIATRLARDPEVAELLATDVSSQALAVAARALSVSEDASKVRFVRRPAHDFSDIGARAFDLVILNSAAQYFPGAAYLESVLCQAIDATAAGGSVFVGDVRNLRLLPAFQLSKVLARDAPDSRASDVRGRVEAGINSEAELVLDPGFFAALLQRSERVTAVEIDLKPSAISNELTRFRYDVVIRIEGSKAASAAGETLPFDPLSGFSAIEQAVDRARQNPVRVLGVPNARIVGLCRALEALADPERDVTLGGLAQIASRNTVGALDPAQIYEWAASSGVACAIDWNAAQPGHFDVVLWADGPRPGFDATMAVDRGALANDPATARARRRIESELKTLLGQHLPANWIPPSITILPTMPRGKNGKMDRGALPRPAGLRPKIARGFVPAQGDTEATLARIWCGLLRIQRVGRHDNFFELGGDSIISMQMVARARAAGLTLKPGDAFKWQTIADLAAAAGSAADATTGGIRTGPIELTPSQHSFVRTVTRDRHHWNQALLLEIVDEPDHAALDRAVDAVIAQHDGLRTAFRFDGPSFLQAEVLAPEACAAGLRRVRLAESPDVGDLNRRILADLQSGFALDHPSLLTAALLEAADATRLLLICHHLAIDSVSWRILIDDLAEAYLAARRGAPDLPPAPNLRVVMQRVAALANESTLRSEADWWLAQRPHSVALLPGQQRYGEYGLAAENAEVSVSLDPSRLGLILSGLAEVKARIDEALLAALVRALTVWSGGCEHVLTLETHGRQFGTSEIDLSRAIGWFASAYPLRFVLDPGGDRTDDLNRVRRILRDTPGKGAHFGLLAEFHSDEAVRTKLRQQAFQPVAFTFFGDLDRQAPSDGPFRLSQGDAGPRFGAQAPRLHLLEVDAYLLKGQLHLTVSFSAGVHDRATMEGLAWAILRGLELMDAEQLSKSADAGLIPEFLPHDLSASEFAEALKEIEQG